MIDDAALIARLDRLPDKIRVALAEEIDRLAGALRRRAGGPAAPLRARPLAAAGRRYLQSASHTPAASAGPSAALAVMAPEIRASVVMAIRRELLR